MKKLFIVSSNRTTAEQDQTFHEWFESRLNWWKWFDQTWMFVDLNGTYTANEIRDAFKANAPGVHVMVYEISEVGNTWSGFGPSSQTDPEKNMFTWITENWKLD